MASTLSSLGAPSQPEGRAVQLTIAGLTAFVVVAVMVVMGLGGGHSAAAERPTPTVVAQLNVALNAGSAVALALGFWFIRRRRAIAHKRAMLTAFTLSSLFLVGYLVHHAQVGSVPFRGEGWIRSVYYGLLVPHVVLAAAIVPLALLTLYRGWTGRLERHRAIARWTLPLWFFVSLSGVAVYVILYHA